MDIPTTLYRFFPGIYWGPQAGSHSTYAKLKKHWPADNPTLPTKAEMEAEWQVYLSEQPPVKTEAEFKTEITAYVNTAANSKKLLAALAIEQLKRNKDFFTNHDIPIEGQL